MENTTSKRSILIVDDSEFNRALLSDMIAGDYDIKHSKERTPEQYKNLIDESKCRDTEFRHGLIVGKFVIYRGETTSLNDIKYLNVEEYLKAL